MTTGEVKVAVDAGAVPLDVRTPRVFVREHVPGAINLQFNRADLVERAEMALPKEPSLIVHGEPEPIAKTALELLGDAGFHIVGHLAGGLRAWKAEGYPVAAMPVLHADELRQRLDGVQVVDAREPFEYKYAHIPGAFLLPWHEAWVKIDSVPAVRPLAVVCGDEVRSAYLASALRRAGRDASLVLGGMTDWLERGFPTEKGLAPV